MHAATIADAAMPPTKPSTVFFGLALGAIGWRPAFAEDVLRDVVQLRDQQQEHDQPTAPPTAFVASGSSATARCGSG